MTVHCVNRAAENFAPLPRSTESAHVIRSDVEAIAIAESPATATRDGASRQDRERLVSVEKLDALSQSGLFAINAPKAFGVAGVSYVTLARVARRRRPVACPDRAKSTVAGVFARDIDFDNYRLIRPEVEARLPQAANKAAAMVVRRLPVAV